MFIVLLFVGFLTTIVSAAENNIRYQNSDFGAMSPFIENTMLSSARYTQEEDMRQIDPSDFIQVRPTDTKMLENDTFELYMDDESLSFKVLDKRTGYVWNTAIDNIRSENLRSSLTSGISIDYKDTSGNYARYADVGIIDIVYTKNMTVEDNKIIMDLNLGAYCPVGRCQRFYQFYLEGRAGYDMDRIINDTDYTELGIEMQFIVELTEEGLVASVPYESINTYNPDISLASVSMFPGLGATHKDDTPGYMIIPDGVGALIRYKDNEGKLMRRFDERYYGDNLGIVTERMTDINYPLSMPIFGAVHGVHQQAYLGIIESGEMSARLLAYPSGAGFQPYNLIYPKFDYNGVYRQSFSDDGSVSARRLVTLNQSDIRVRYNFLVNDDADYVGLALDYQSYLVNRGHLNGLQSHADRIPIHLQYLMADSKNQFIGNSIVEMSSVDAVFSMYDYFYEQGISNQRVSLMGWNRGGYSGQLPSPVRFERSVGSPRDFTDLIQHISKDNEVLLLNNYVFAGDSASRVSTRQDTALGVNRRRLQYECWGCVHPTTSLLNPEVSYDLALSDLEDYKDLGASVMFETLGSLLFSYYRRELFTRVDAFEHYDKLMNAYNGVGSYVYPHAYAYQYTKDFYQAPLYNSQLTMYDDLVPILPIVLRGHMELYSQFLNFNSLGKSQLLMLVDFGINPSFILSEQRASMLLGTDIEQYFSTQFSIWSSNILEQYTFVSEALNHVIGESITSREVLELGVIKVTYSNGVAIIVNYTQSSYDYFGTDVSPLDYYVKGVTS